MVEAFCATWKLTDSQNFDEYMKALGGCKQDVPFSSGPLPLQIIADSFFTH